VASIAVSTSARQQVIKMTSRRRGESPTSGDESEVPVGAAALSMAYVLA
jgi:hypothetical protein